MILVRFESSKEFYIGSPSKTFECFERGVNPHRTIRVFWSISILVCFLGVSVFGICFSVSVNSIVKFQGKKTCYIGTLTEAGFGKDHADW